VWDQVGQIAGRWKGRQGSFGGWQWSKSNDVIISTTVNIRTRILGRDLGLKDTLESLDASSKQMRDRSNLAFSLDVFCLGSALLRHLSNAGFVDFQVITAFLYSVQ
jgi:hypothetical protein